MNISIGFDEQVRARTYNLHDVTIFVITLLLVIYAKIKLDTTNDFPQSDP